MAIQPNMTHLDDDGDNDAGGSTIPLAPSQGTASAHYHPEHVRHQAADAARLAKGFTPTRELPSQAHEHGHEPHRK